MSIDLSNKSSYEILGVREYSTNSEITERYKELKAKYSEERFLPGEAGNDAAAMLEAVEEAYREIMTERKADGFGEKPKEEEIPNKEADSEPTYRDVDELIKAGKLDEAQRALDSYDNRLAEWHYLQAVVYYKKNWGHECKKQMEIAMAKDPDNAKYKTTYEKLCKEMEYKNKNFYSSGNAADGGNGRPNKDFDPYERQMGGDDCLDSCLRCLACNMLLNCCCNCR